ncbi:nuclear transport factor 2 family protein [Algoriphagus mannitolivorans]|uniref:nuclear transport factor 2 family protein n=1 Tax=Algoriphagus mannitolivorans TaxID=226504 RepID=UPI00041F37D8|nr:nuclear transport factor 2 family protein [Algoriphagus mannitolivorans]
MKKLLWILLIIPSLSFSQINPDQKEQAVRIHKLINDYSKAREAQDTASLKKLLMEDVDQLVSSGQWRNGIQEAIAGMQASSQTNPGTRTLKIDKMRFLSDEIVLVDCRYVITNPEGVSRNLWSSFLVVFHKRDWKISAIRNMSPTN